MIILERKKKKHFT